MRIATYNTQAGLDGTSNEASRNSYCYVFKLRKFPRTISSGMKQAVADVLRLQADLICLNEIPVQWIGQVIDLLGGAGYIGFNYSATKAWFRWHVGTIIASRLNGYVAERGLHLPKENTFQGGGGSAAIYLPETNIMFVGTHLGWEARFFVRRIDAQIAYLTSWCKGQISACRSSLIIAGDLNRENLEETPLASLNLNECQMPTFPSWNPKRQLDHILFPRTLRATDSSTFKGNSDHAGLYADIEWI